MEREGVGQASLETSYLDERSAAHGQHKNFEAWDREADIYMRSAYFPLDGCAHALTLIPAGSKEW